MKSAGKQDKSFLWGESVLTALWVLFFFALAFVPDIKLARYKLVSVQVSLLVLFFLFFVFKLKKLKEIFISPISFSLLLITALWGLHYFLSVNRVSAFTEFQRMAFSAIAFLSAWMLFPRRKIISETALVFAGAVCVYAVMQKSGGNGIRSFSHSGQGGLGRTCRLGFFVVAYMGKGKDSGL
ncbi:MAG: hypothetical protein ACQESB_05055 [Elusimicrobiota bacterium]